MMKKLAILAALLLALPALAQRGPDGRPLQNYAETCTVYGTVTDGASCSGRPKVWCVNYTTNFIYACNPTTGVWDAVGSATGGGSGGTTITVESDNTSVLSTCSILNFGTDFSVSDAGSGQADIGVNDSALAVNLANGTGIVAIANGGTGQISAGSALLALGAAGRGANSDITSLSGLTTPLSVPQGGSGLNAVTTNQTYVGSASNTFIARTIPNCTTGSNLQFKTSGTCASTGETAPCYDCAADGAAGTGTLKDVQEEGVTLGSSGSGTTINFVGGHVTASGTGATKTITLSTTPDSASAVGSGRTITAGAGLSGTSTLASDVSLATASQEASFLADGGVSALTCGASNQGKAQVMDAGPLSWCDGAATSVVQYAALADSSGNAQTGDNAASFFQAGVLEVARGGTNSSSIGSDTQVLFNSTGSVAGDSGFTYVASTDTATVGVLVTSGGADGTWGDTFRNNTIEPSAPSSTFTLLYAFADEIYKKDNGDSTNERLMLNSGNVAGDLTCAATGTCDLGTGVVGATELASTAVTPGSYTAADITVDADGRITAAANGAGGAGDITAVGPYTSGAAFTDGAVSSGTTMFTWEGTTSDTNEFLVAAPSADPGADVTVTFPGATDTLVAKATTDTFTNKTLDTEGTGNILYTVERTWVSAAGCNDVTSSAFFDLEAAASGGAVSACITASNLTRGVLDFDQTTEEDAHLSFMLPSDFCDGTTNNCPSNSLDINIKWLSSDNTGSVIWGVQTTCTGDGAILNTSLNAASTVTDAAKGTTLQTNDAAITNVTKTGCDPGEMIHLRFFRDADDGSDTTASDARLFGIEIVYRRKQ